MQFIFNFVECALQKKVSGVTQIGPSHRLIQEQRDKEGREGRERGFCRSLTRGRARGSVARVSRLEDGSKPKLWLSVESGGGFAVGVLAPFGIV